MGKFLPIGALAKATETKVETIRYYESIGLMPVPARTQGNYRAYDETHLARLSFVRRARDLGFSIETVRDLLKIADRNRRDCRAVGPIAKAHVTEIDRKIADLRALRRELQNLMAQCGTGTIQDCRVIEALSPQAGVGPALARRQKE